MIHARVHETLPIIARVGKAAVGRQQKRRQRVREERRPVLPRVVGGGEEEGLVLDKRSADRAGELIQLIRNVHRVDRRERGGRDATCD